MRMYFVISLKNTGTNQSVNVFFVVHSSDVKGIACHYLQQH